MIVVHGLNLPTAFETFVRTFDGTLLYWVLGGGVDAYGNRFAADFETTTNLSLIEQSTKELALYFGAGDMPPEVVEKGLQEARTRPGFIPYIEDFSKIVWFGRTAAGAPYCFDFRENERQPSIIHWDDGGGHWRRIAPDFQTFIGLLDPYGEEYQR
jgi:SMI1 / KNR4 family (SUKH-1)